MLLKYHYVRKGPALFAQLCGITSVQFEELYSRFLALWGTSRSNASNRPRRRAPRGGRKYALEEHDIPMMALI